jgi:3-dehydroquinate synthase
VATIELLTYRIIVEPGSLDRVGDLVREVAAAHRYALLTDERAGPLYAARVRESLGAESVVMHQIRSGESEKTRENWIALTDAMLADGLGRDTTVIALGGGVVGDLAGFVAATFMRGVPFVQVPTTLLAMVDASVGGKTGVDTPAGKNLVGAFHQPAVVVADTDVLRTLPPPHFRSGMAEAIKHGVIASVDYFDEVVTVARSMERWVGSALDLTPLVAGSVRIKAAVVADDEREAGRRKILNFGHTLGHAVESCSEYTLLHGQAIAIGMVLEAEIAERMSIASSGTANRIRDVLDLVGLPDRPPSWLDPDQILERTRTDKKARGGRVEYALPIRIGAMAGATSGWSIAVDDDVVRTVLHTAHAP